MKKTLLFLGMGSLVFFGFQSCKKKEVDVSLKEGSTIEMSTPTGVPKFTYIINVRDASTSSFDSKSTTGLNGATVEIIGTDGSSKTATADANGNATFTGVPEGIITGVVSNSGYTTVHFTAMLESNIDPESLQADVTNMATTNILVWPLDATVTGRIYGDFDDSGIPNYTDSDDLRSNVTVKIGVQGDQPGSAYSGWSDVGMLLESYIETSVFTGTTNSNGEFTISNLPGNDGNLTIMMDVQTFAIDTMTFTMDPVDISGDAISGETNWAGNYVMTKTYTDN